MTVPQVNSQPPATENKPSDKEINFRQQEKAMQDKYERQLAMERQARLEAEKKLQESNRKQQHEDDDDDDEPYVDKKKLNKKLNQYKEQFTQENQSEMQKAIQMALKEERRNQWVDKNKDFYDVIRDHSEKLYQTNPELAENILEMPEGFERQKLVYQNIKALGLHKPKETSIQDKVDANRRSPSYQPSGMGTSPYTQNSDFSPAGQKQAYAKMQELKSKLRI